MCHKLMFYLFQYIKGPVPLGQRLSRGLLTSFKIAYYMTINHVFGAHISIPNNARNFCITAIDHLPMLL